MFGVCFLDSIGTSDVTFGGFDENTIRNIVKEVRNNRQIGFNGNAAGTGEPAFTLDQLVALAKLYVRGQ